VFGKKKKNEEGEVKEQMGELKEQPSNSSGKKPKVSKGFGNTIILFILFFIVFTVIVTGVAFFADRIDLSGGKEKNLEEIAPKEKMTDPEEGEAKEYTMDEKGNLESKKPEERDTQMTPLMKTEKKPAAIPPAKKEAVKEAPLPPVNIKPVIEKPKPKPKKGVKKEAPKPTGLATLNKKITRGDYVVQLASFKNKSYADAEQKKLSRTLTDVFVTRVDLGEKGIWYRLRAYNGVSREEANAKSRAIASRTQYKPYPMKK